MRRYVVTIIFLLLTVDPARSEELFPLWPELDNIYRQWFSKHLNAMDEQPIMLGQSGSTYRFLWLRSFDNPISVTVRCLESCNLSAKRLSGAGGYEPGEVSESVSRVLSKTEQEEFQKLAQASHLFRGQPESEIIGLDGANWVFESAQADKYVAWNVWSPQYEAQFKNFQNLCEYMIHLSGFKIEKDAFY